jgi:hypothetical protein
MAMVTKLMPRPFVPMVIRAAKRARGPCARERPDRSRDKAAKRRRGILQAKPNWPRGVVRAVATGRLFRHMTVEAFCKTKPNRPWAPRARANDPARRLKVSRTTSRLFFKTKPIPGTAARGSGHPIGSGFECPSRYFAKQSHSDPGPHALGPTTLPDGLKFANDLATFFQNKANPGGLLYVAATERSQGASGFGRVRNPQIAVALLFHGRPGERRPPGEFRMGTFCGGGPDRGIRGRGPVIRLCA